MTAKQKNILLVDDEERLLNSMAQRISLLGFNPIKALSGTKAIEIAKQNHIDLAIVDLKMPDIDGLVTITKLKELLPDLKTVLLTGYGSKKTKEATEALGSLYVEKDSMGGLWDLIKRSNDEGKMVVIKPSKDNTARRSGSAQTEHYNGRVEVLADSTEYGREPAALPKIIGDSPQMNRLQKNITRLADLDCAIIIQGETGTGKELTARTIHRLSSRQHQRFLAFDCGCFSNDFKFNELVGSVKPQAGRFQFGKDDDAQDVFSGTILLDHVGNMPESIQTEMIHIIDRKNAGQRLSPGSPAMDIRFIIATGPADMDKSGNGKIPVDLLNRLNAMELSIPPLRERKSDIRQLSHYLLSLSNKDFDKEITTISDKVMSIFKSYDFPGNVRELKHIIERAVILASGHAIEVEHLPERFTAGRTDPAIDMQDKIPSLSEMEKRHILKVVEMTGGNKSKAADLLGISRAALWRKLKLMKSKS